MDAQIIKGFKLRKSDVCSVRSEGDLAGLFQSIVLKSEGAVRLGADLAPLHLQQVLPVDDDVLETPGEVGIVQGGVGPGREPCDVILGPPQQGGRAPEILRLVSEAVNLDHEDLSSPGESYS